MELSWTDFPDLTLLIRRVQAGDKAAENQLFSVGYQHLRRLAARQLTRETRFAETTAHDLLHDVYLNRIRTWQGQIADRNHYAALVCLALRAELCDRARKRDASKRTPPADAGRSASPASRLSVEDILALENEIARLEAVDPRAAHVVILRFYGGCSWSETAATTGASVKAVRNDWGFAANWLAKRLGRKLF